MKNRIKTYASGCLLFAIGAKFFINSKMGVDPLDTLVIGLAQTLGSKIGTASAIVAIIFLVIWSLWNKRLPILTPFVTMTVVGYLIDFMNYLVPTPNTTSLLNAYLLMASALLICSFASSLIIMSGIGIRTMDLVALTITQKFKFQFFISKGIIELSFIIFGILLGGPYGIATLAFLVSVGPLIQIFIKLNSQLFGMFNHSIGESASLI